MWIDWKRQVQKFDNYDIKEITGQRRCTASGCIKSRDGDVIMEKDKVLERWTEYIWELFDDNRIRERYIKKDMNVPAILKAEVGTTVKKMKSNKAAGPDEIVVQQLNYVVSGYVVCLFSLFSCLEYW